MAIDKSKQKELTYKKILEVATKVFKKEGYLGASVQKIMGAADLTVGGFYAHFKSKKILFSKMIRSAMKQRREFTDSQLGSLEGTAWAKEFVSMYLGEDHRDAIELGCSMPSLVAEIPRAGDEAQSIFNEELHVTTERLTAHLDGDRTSALAVLSICLGGLGLARATNNVQVSKQILNSCIKKAHHLIDGL